MKKFNLIKLTSLAVLLAGTTLFTPDFTVKAEPCTKYIKSVPST